MEQLKQEVDQIKKTVGHMMQDKRAYNLVLTGLDGKGDLKWQLLRKVRGFLEKHFSSVKFKITNVVCFAVGIKSITKVTLDSAIDRNSIVDIARKQKSAFDGIWVSAYVSKEKQQANYAKRSNRRLNSSTGPKISEIKSKS